MGVYADYRMGSIPPTGQLHLIGLGTGQDGEQIRFTPASLQTLGFDADFGRLFLAE